LFCKIIKKEEPAHIVYEDDLVCCFLDIEPINNGHILIVPKKHYLDIDEMDEEILIRISKISKCITKIIKDTFNPDGYTIMQNGGFFNEIGHYHMHVFPRYIKDEFNWSCKEIDDKLSFDDIKNHIISHLNNNTK
jgi:diadenosine tetraphosphate (Ap4A) HIT family hydrolase